MHHRQAQKIGEGAIKRVKLCLIFLYSWFMNFDCICEFIGYCAMQWSLNSFFLHALNTSELLAQLELTAVTQT